ncbi:hypothetical protein BIV59_19605 [Bacillus sp. MUM 13]|nr:hypothetical protein BIV59_19605 [Bacillus sp. MUM 13]
MLDGRFAEGERKPFCKIDSRKFRDNAFFSSNKQKGNSYISGLHLKLPEGMLSCHVARLDDSLNILMKFCLQGNGGNINIEEDVLFECLWGEISPAIVMRTLYVNRSQTVKTGGHYE